MRKERRQFSDHSSDAGAGVLRQFSQHRALLTVLLGLGFVLFVVYLELLKDGLTVVDLFTRMDWTVGTLLWLALGVLMMAMRDCGYIWLLRNLTDGKIGWRSGFENILL